jgi:hypothetical protein
MSDPDWTDNPAPYPWRTWPQAFVMYGLMALATWGVIVVIMLKLAKAPQ